jgi:hypothetical protein
MSRAVPNRNVRTGRLPVAQDSGQGAADFTHSCFIFLVLRREKVFAEVADYILPQISSDALRALIPELDALIPSDEIDAGVNAFQNGSQNVEVFDNKHGYLHSQ